MADYRVVQRTKNYELRQDASLLTIVCLHKTETLYIRNEDMSVTPITVKRPELFLMHDGKIFLRTVERSDYIFGESYKALVRDTNLELDFLQSVINATFLK